MYSGINYGTPPTVSTGQRIEGVNGIWRNTDQGSEWIPFEEYRPAPPAEKTPAQIEAERAQALVEQINQQFATPERQAMYQTARDDVFGVQRARLDENRQTAQRGLGFSLAGRGLTGGSADIDARAQEGRAYTDGLLSAQGAAESSANNLRANDEKTRLTLAQAIRSGENDLSSTQAALEQSRLNASAARSAAGYEAADRYLQSAGNIYSQYQQNQGVAQARSQYPGGTGIFGNVRPTYGQVAR